MRGIVVLGDSPRRRGPRGMSDTARTQPRSSGPGPGSSVRSPPVRAPSGGSFAIPQVLRAHLPERCHAVRGGSRATSGSEHGPGDRSPQGMSVRATSCRPPTIDPWPTRAGRCAGALVVRGAGTSPPRNGVHRIDPTRRLARLRHPGSGDLLVVDLRSAPRSTTRLRRRELHVVAGQRRRPDERRRRRWIRWRRPSRRPSASGCRPRGSRRCRRRRPPAGCRPRSRSGGP